MNSELGGHQVFLPTQDLFSLLEAKGSGFLCGNHPYLILGPRGLGGIVPALPASGATMWPGLANESTTIPWLTVTGRGPRV